VLATTSPLVSAADATFDLMSPYPGSGFRNHCLRLYEFARQLLRAEGLRFDADTAYAIAMVHDLGLVHSAPGDNYLLRSVSIFEERLGSLAKEDAALVRRCLLLNHRVLPVAGAEPAVEAFRRAVWIEHSRGIKRFGLPKADVEEVFELYPRDNLDQVLLDFFGRTLRNEPHTILRGIFF
jgi:HD domain